MRELSIEEYNKLNSYLDICGYELNNTKVYWDSDHFGAYHVIGDYITIQDTPLCLRMFVPCIVHELIHQMQRKTMGVFWYKIIGYRLWAKYTIEIDAIRHELIAEQILGITV